MWICIFAKLKRRESNNNKNIAMTTTHECYGTIPWTDSVHLHSCEATHTHAKLFTTNFYFINLTPEKYDIRIKSIDHQNWFKSHQQHVSKIFHIQPPDTQLGTPTHFLLAIGNNTHPIAEFFSNANMRCQLNAKLLNAWHVNIWRRKKKLFVGLKTFHQNQHWIVYHVVLCTELFK